MEVDEEQPALKRPINHDLRDFGMFYAVMAALIILLSRVTDQTEPLWGLSMFASAMIVAGRFVKREGRAPSKAERDALTRGCLWISLLISLIPLSLFAIGFFEIGFPADMIVWLILFCIFGLFLVLSLTYLFLDVAYGPLARRVADKLNR